MKLLANLSQLNRIFNRSLPPDENLIVLYLDLNYYAVSIKTANRILDRSLNKIKDVEPMLLKRAKYIFRMPTPHSISFLRQDAFLPKRKLITRNNLTEHGYKILP